MILVYVPGLGDIVDEVPKNGKGVLKVAGYEIDIFWIHGWFLWAFWGVLGFF